MPEDAGSLETLSVGIEADVSRLLQGARDGVDETSAILETIPPVTPEINTLPMLGKITEVINRYTELQLTVEQVVGAINAGLAENASAVENLAGMMLEYSAIQQQSLASTGREFIAEGIATPAEVQGVIEHLAQLGDQYGATQEQVIAFAGQMDAARTALHEMGMSYAETGDLIGRTHAPIEETASQLEQLIRPTEGAASALITLTQELHGRTTFALVNALRQIDGEVRIIYRDVEALGTNFSQVLGLLAGPGATLEVRVESEDALATLQQVHEAFDAARLVGTEAWTEINMAAEFPTDVPPAIRAISEELDRAALSSGQFVAVIQQGQGEAATHIEALASDIAQTSAIIDQSIGETAIWFHQLGRAGEEELGRVVEHLAQLPPGFEASEAAVTGYWERLRETTADVEDFMESQRRDVPTAEWERLEVIFQGLAISATEAAEIMKVGFAQGASDVQEAAAQIARDVAEGMSPRHAMMEWTEFGAVTLDNAQQIVDHIDQVKGSMEGLGTVQEAVTQESTDSWGRTLVAVNLARSALDGMVLTAEQATVALLEGTGASASAIQQWTRDIVVMSQEVGIPFSKIIEMLITTGQISGEVSQKIITNLRRIAKTEVNESPLSASLRSIQALLDGIVDRARQAVTAVTGLGQQVPGGRLEQVGIVPDASLMERAGQRISGIWRGIQAAGTSAVGRLQQSLQGLRASEDDAADGATNLAAIINRGMQEGAAMTDQLAAFVGRLAQENDMAVQEVIAGLVDSRQISKDVGKDLLGIFGEAEQGATGLGKVLGSLGTVAKSVFGVAFGLTAVKAIRKVIDLMKEAAETAIQLATNFVRLDIAVRAAQRTYGEQVGTIESWRGHVQELNDEFENLSQVQLAEGAAQTVLLTRELQLNEEQMMRVYRTASTLASLHGIQMRQALNLTVQGLTGIGRGLRRYGVFLSRAQLNQEAFSMGLNKTWSELNSNERALVALNVMMRQVEPIMEDLTHLYGTLGGRVQVATANLEDARAELGRIGAPLVVLAKEGLAAIMTMFGEGIKALTQITSVAMGATIAFHTFVLALTRGVPVAEALTAASQAYGATVTQMADQFGLLGPLLEDVEGGVDFGEAEEDLEEIIGTLEKYGDRFEDALIAYGRALADAAEDLEEKLADLHRKYERQLAEALEDLMNALADLERQYVRKRADIIQDANDKLADLDEEGLDKRAKMIADHFIKMRRMWEDHQTKLRRMREDFEDTMREAVSKRDAWGAVQAIRAFAKNRRRAIEDYDTRRRRAEEDFARRLAELDNQNEEERRRILEAMRRQLEDLEIWRARRREELHEDHAEDLEDLAIANAEQEEEIRRTYAQRLEDIELGLERKLVAIAEAMADEEAVTAAGADAVFRALFKVFGFGGDIDQLMDAFEKRLARNIKIKIAVESAYGESAIPGMQHGGTIVARKPTLVEFGEAGPEMATFTPLNKWSRMQTTAQHAGTLRVEVSADEHFSADFEDMVAQQLSSFVRRVVA